MDSSNLYSVIRYDFFDPAYLSVFEPYFNSMRMSCTVCKNILNPTFRQLPAALIFFEYNRYVHAGFNIGPLIAFVHNKKVTFGFMVFETILK